MKRFLRTFVPLLLVAALIATSLWYFMIYDKDFTRDMILQQAHQQESKGNRKTANWLYNLAYKQSQQEENVAIELAHFFIAAGNYTKAEFTLTNAIADGGDAQLYIALCKTYLEQGKFLDAVNMLDHITNPEILAKVSALRPAAPVLSPEPGFYSTYITVGASADSGTIYLNSNGLYPDIRQDIYTEPVQLPQGESVIFALTVSEEGLVSPLTIGNYTVGGIVETVELQSDYLAQQVRDITHKPSSSPIYTNEIWDITEIDIPEGFSDWDDLRYFTGLTSLTVHNTDIPSLSFLTRLTKLCSLDLSASSFPAEDLTYLAYCPALETLTMRSCGLSSISGLEAAANLRQLDLSNNTLRNLAPLAGNSQLRSLNLSRNAVSGLDDLSGLSELHELDLSYNDLVLITPIATLYQLRTLNLSHNHIQSISPLAALSELRELNCADNLVTSLAPLGGCTKMEMLDISENLVSDLSPLSESIMELDFSNNLVEKLPRWTSNCALVKLNGAYNKLTNIASLAGLPDLNTVILDYNEIEDVSMLVDCPRLISLDIFGTKVSDVKALVEMDVVVHYDPTQGHDLPESNED